MSKLVANPGPFSAFVVGILVFTPGVTFIAAMQVIATARASIEAVVTAAILVVIINVLLVWLPIVLHLLAPPPRPATSPPSTPGCGRTGMRCSPVSSWRRE